MLTVRVGKGGKEKDFVAQESFLTSRSEYFRRAMNKIWTETGSRVIELPTEKPDIFALYLSFVYTGQLATMRTSQEKLLAQEAATFQDNIESEYRDVFETYALAEKLQDAMAKNAAITAAIQAMKMRSVNDAWPVPSFNIMNDVYKGTSKGSEARRLLLDMCATLPLATILEPLKNQSTHKDLVSDLTQTLVETYERKPSHEKYSRRFGENTDPQDYFEKLSITPGQHGPAKPQQTDNSEPA